MRPPVGWQECQPAAYTMKTAWTMVPFRQAFMFFFVVEPFSGRGAVGGAPPRKVFSLSPQSTPPHLTPNKFEMHFYDDLKCDV